MLPSQEAIGREPVLRGGVPGPGERAFSVPQLHDVSEQEKDRGRRTGLPEQRDRIITETGLR